MAGERILVIDDEPGVRDAIHGILVDEGFAVSLADSGEAGLELLQHGRFDAILLDVWLPGIDGLETLERIRERVDDCEVVMISGHGTIETAVRATKLGAFDFVEKPLSLEKTLLVLRNALRQRRLRRRNRQLLDQLARETEIVGDSPAAVRLRRAVEAAGSSDAPVSLHGEPGSGREMLARRIHTAGPRRESAFVIVPCAAIDAAAASAMLVGEGSGGRRVEMARGGSILLQDVDLLAADVQRALGAVVGSSDEPAVAVRWLASVSPSARLHPGLAESLEVVVIDVPALRERRDDVPMLVERILADLAREYGRSRPRVSAEAMARLKAFDWPGNLGQLRNTVERALVAASGATIDLDVLPGELGGAREPVEDLYREFGSLDDGIAAFERYYAARVLDGCGRDRARAARRLGVDIQRLERILTVAVERGD